MRVRGMIATALCGVLLLGFGRPAQADPAAAASGAGSTTAENAVRQWAADLALYGLRINYDGIGTTAGQNQFALGLVDFTVTDYPYPTPPERAYASIPLVARATTVAYHLTVDGRPVSGLRLSGATVAGIFTGAITRWNDPAIRADNPAVVLPDRAIIPVVRSDGNGASWAFTGWLAARYPDRWNAWCPGCGARISFPNPDGRFAATAGASGVAALTTQTEGAIAYSNLALDRSMLLPDAKVRNEAGYFTAPTADSVAIGLTAADGSGDLGPVYANADPRAYPLVGFENLIVPTTNLSEDRGRALTRFAGYAVCEGQARAQLLGYGALPVNLSRVALDRLRQVPGADLAALDPAACANPAADVLTTAPYPSDCDSCQVITTTVPRGALYLSVTPGEVVLPTPVLTPDGEKLRTGGDLPTITVTDTRAGNPGWSLAGQVTDFTDGGTHTIPAANLGWTPTLIDRAAVQDIRLGAPATGLADPATLAQAPGGFGVGTARLGARLSLDVPTTTPPGTYRATLTYTLI